MLTWIVSVTYQYLKRFDRVQTNELSRLKYFLQSTRLKSFKIYGKQDFI